MKITLLVIMFLTYALPSANATYPEKNVLVVVPFAAGDGSDTVARLASQELAKTLGVSFVVINRPGAGGAIGVESVVKSHKDGYTIMFTTNTALTVRRVVYPSETKYDPARDLVPLGIIARFPSILAVRSDSQHKSLAEMLEFAKKNPGTLRFSTPGVGSLGELNLAIMGALSEARIFAIPYKGSTPAVVDLLGGHVYGVATSLGAASAHITAGSLRGIAISKRFPGFDIPTLSESGYKEDILGIWVGFFAPTGVPEEVARALVPAIKRVAGDKDLAEKLVTRGMSLEYSSPVSVQKEIDRETKMVEGIVKKMAASK